MSCWAQVPRVNSSTQTGTASDPWRPLSESSWVARVAMSRVDTEIVSEQIPSAHRGQQCLHRALHLPSPPGPVSQRPAGDSSLKSLYHLATKVSPLPSCPPHHQAPPFRTCSLSQWSEQFLPRPHTLPSCWRGLLQSTARTTTTPFPNQAPRPLLAPPGTPGLPEGLLPLPQSAH